MIDSILGVEILLLLLCPCWFCFLILDDTVDVYDLELLLLTGQNFLLASVSSKVFALLSVWSFSDDFKVGEWNLWIFPKSFPSFIVGEEMSIKLPVDRAGRSIPWRLPERTAIKIIFVKWIYLFRIENARHAYGLKLKPINLSSIISTHICIKGYNHLFLHPHAVLVISPWFKISIVN